MLIDTDYLEEPCATCEGNGYVQHPEWAAWWEHNTEVPPDDHPLRWNKVREDMLCPDCKGTGTALTEPGKILVEILRKYL